MSKSSSKKQNNDMIHMAVDTTMFGVGASMIGNASQSFNGNPSAKAMVDATGTLYAAKFLKKTGKGLL